jgi:hypothetical protein
MWISDAKLQHENKGAGLRSRVAAPERETEEAAKWGGL